MILCYSNSLYYKLKETRNIKLTAWNHFIASEKKLYVKSSYFGRLFNRFEAQWWEGLRILFKNELTCYRAGNWRILGKQIASVRNIKDCTRGPNSFKTPCNLQPYATPKALLTPTETVNFFNSWTIYERESIIITRFLFTFFWI